MKMINSFCILKKQNLQLNISIIIICTLLIFFIYPSNAFTGCNTNFTNQKGCIQCDSNTDYLILDIDQNKYTCLSEPCLVRNSTTCIACRDNYPRNDSNGNNCTYQNGCSVVENGNCTQCQPHFILLQNNTCFNTFADKCIQRNKNNYSQCQKCIRTEMNLPNCQVDSSLCKVYNYQLLKCQECPSGKILDSSGRFCYIQVPKCLFYDLTGCIKCQKNYYYNLIECLPNSQKNIYRQIYQNNGSTIDYLYICRQQNYFYDSSNCINSTLSIKNCQILSNSSSQQCKKCINGYFLSSSSTCSPCYLSISNCLMCTSQTTCQVCQDGYFMLAIDTSTCLSCQTIFGCPLCTSSLQMNTTQIQSSRTQCLKCNQGQTLFDGGCYKCDSSYGFSLDAKECLKCSDNCQSCQFNFVQGILIQACIWCIDGFALTNLTCTNISLIKQGELTFDNIYQVLIKSSPETNQLIYNNQTKLISKCGQDTDGYICKCPNSNILNISPFKYNSLCRTFNKNIQFNFTTLFGTSVNITNFILYSKLILMASEFTNYALSINISTSSNIFLTPEQFATLLQIHQIRTMHSTSLSTPFYPNLYSVTKDIMKNVFPDDINTLIFGNGFHFKYSPNNNLSSTSFLSSSSFSNQGNSFRVLAANPTQSSQDQYIKVSVNTSSWIMVYVRFDPQPLQNITGKIYVFTGDNKQLDCNVTVRKIGYVDDISSLKILMNGLQQNTTSGVNLSAGYLTFTMKTSISSSPQGFQITYQSSNTTTTDPYSSSRIQNLFYNQSFIYILFFIVVYLISIPVFSMVDFCQVESHRRKHVNQIDQQFQNQNKSRQQQKKNQYKYHDGSQAQGIVFINYKQFFPLYNIGSTPRPRRIIKLCLFILNMQHSVTFLVLIFFQLQPSQPIIGVILGIPAYLCTVIMGYICGFLTVVIPGNFKYLVNIIVPGYWIIWIIIMPLFISQQYKPFIYIYVCIFFFIDMFFDGVQTLLVYFAIYQTQKQTALFSCLSKWLSYRGYYQYQSLAKEIIDE